MYKKYATVLLLGNLIVLAALVCVRGIQVNRILASQAYGLDAWEALGEYDSKAHSFVGQVVSSGQRIVDFDILEPKWMYQISKEDYEVLLRIVEAEAGGEREKGKLLVANVILNRMNHEKYPDTIKEVVFQNNGQTWQFSPVCDGRYYTVKISEETVQAVEKALMGEDISEGALFFVSRAGADPERMKWFDENLEFLFSYGGHEFFK